MSSFWTPKPKEPSEVRTVMAQEGTGVPVPRKAEPAPRPRAASVLDAIDALESRRRRRGKPSGLFPKPKGPPDGDLDLDTIR